MQNHFLICLCLLTHRPPQLCHQVRGDQVKVENVKFSHDTSAAGGTETGSALLDFDKNDIMRGVELLVLLVTGLLLIFFVLRPLLKTANTTGVPALAGAAGGGVPGVTQLQTVMVDGVPQLVGPGTEMDQRLDIARIEGQVKASSVKKVAEFVQNHPDESTAILRGWLHET